MDYTTPSTAPRCSSISTIPSGASSTCAISWPDTGYGERALRRLAHPRAIFLHLDRGDLSGPMTGTNGRHPLPDAERLKARLGAVGIGNDTQVVVTDDAQGMIAGRSGGCCAGWGIPVSPFSMAVSALADRRAPGRYRPPVAGADAVCRLSRSAHGGRCGDLLATSNPWNSA